MLRRLYLSPLGVLISWAQNLLALCRRPFTVYGYFDHVSRARRKFTRVSSTAVISSREKVSMGDHVWVSHYAIIDGSCGVTIGRGCQICAWVGIYSHGSQNALRLHGDEYIRIPHRDRHGYARGTVEIGDFTFIGAHATVLPGVKIGKGALIASGAVVTKDVPDFGFAMGSPAKIVGDTRERDQDYWHHPEVQKSYFDPESMESWLMLRAASVAEFK